ncbi:MAG: PD40 domain-containing protein [Parcubacteria group bacterium]|nr:PD40 domain-containing protein [Parcubacteria group bacterium]
MSANKKSIIIIIISFVFLIFLGLTIFILSRPGLFMFTASPITGPDTGYPKPSPNAIPTSNEIQNLFLKDAGEKLGENFITVSASNEEYDVPFQFDAGQKVFADDGKLLVNSWTNNDNFLFTKFFNSENILEDFEQYRYDFKTGAYKNIGRGSKNFKEWIGSSAVSLDGKFLVSVVSGTPSITTVPDNLGAISIKNLETGQTTILGKKTFHTGVDGSYISNSYYNPTWSPDGKYIAFYDDQNWNQDGRGVSVIKSNAKSLSEMVFLGRTAFIETERSPWEEYIFWSPDSTKLFVKDSNVIFSVEPTIREIYRPRGEKKWGDQWRWSPDSKKVLGSAYNSFGFYIIDLNNKEKHGFLLKTDFMKSQDFEAGSVDWAPDSIHIVYAFDKALYIIDSKTGKHKKIIADQADYKNPRWSPDGKKIVYQKDHEIWLTEVYIK